MLLVSQTSVHTPAPEILAVFVSHPLLLHETIISHPVLSEKRWGTHSCIQLKNEEMVVEKSQGMESTTEFFSADRFRYDARLPVSSVLVVCTWARCDPLVVAIGLVVSAEGILQEEPSLLSLFPCANAQIRGIVQQADCLLSVNRSSGPIREAQQQYL